MALVIVDTLSATHLGLEENSAGDMAAYMGFLAGVAEAGDCAVELIHHVAKGAAGRNGDMFAARGSGATVGAARIVRTVGALSEDDAEDLGFDPALARGLVRVDAAKSNYGPSGTTRWFQRVLVSCVAADPRDPSALPSVQVPVLVSTAAPAAQPIAVTTTPAMLDEALNRFRQGPGPGQKYSRAHSGKRQAVPMLEEVLSASPDQAKIALDKMIRLGMLREISYWGPGGNEVRGLEIDPNFDLTGNWRKDILTAMGNCGATKKRKSK